ncbi:MAG: hypothetical protein ACFFAZ_06670 [Promethearchaeota archaeon]
MSKYDLIGPKPVSRTQPSLTTAALGASRRYFEVVLGLITAGILIIPVLYYPGLGIIIIFAEVYLIDVVYARMFGARVKMSIPFEKGKDTRKSPIGMFNDISEVRATGLALLNR